MGLHIQELVTTFTEKDSTATRLRSVTAVTTAIQYAGIGLSTIRWYWTKPAACDGKKGWAI
ncbi:hypothetical protein PITC_085900 [Penicillium italicum]|uniref:Uncharacterized protein n=1 Tax=Penicillium italicum TaxID=40296 RepID=A0A0A2L292_PENIT|nr:hypothetical protein PITC_085900 [Penicillium italicum]